MVLLQRYYWFKRSDTSWVEDGNPFPLGVEYLYRDTVTTLRPRLQLFTSLEEAEAAVTTLQEELLAMLPPVSSPDTQTLTGSLAPIAETPLEEEEEEEEDGDTLSPDTRPQAARARGGLHTIAENEEGKSDWVSVHLTCILM
jgi:regulator of nonsense transcripts 2